MTYTTYVDGDGAKKNRKVRNTGTTVDPYESYVVDADANTATGTPAQAPANKTTLTTTGTTPYSIIQLLKGILLNTGGGSGGSFTPGQTNAAGSQSVVSATDDPVNLATGTQADSAPATTTGNGSIIGILKGFWTAFGLISQAADTTGSLMQRVRGIGDRIGSFGDAATSTGSLMAQLRHLGDSLNRAFITSAINISASGDSTILAATASRQIVITNLYFTVDSTANITFKNGATAISGAMPLSTYASDQSRIILSTNTAFVINVSATANVRGYITYYLM